MNKKCLISSLILISIIIGGTYKFVFQGSIEPSSDNRTSILLNDAERNLVLAEMRMFLSSVQQINQAIVDDNLEDVAAAARAVGGAAQGAVPGSLIGKLPLQFKKLGFDTHSKFDQLAMDADDLGDNIHSLSQLATLMQNCVACHEAYRIDLEK